MALTEFVIMPGADYQAICDKVREKTGGEELLKSGDIPSALENISGGGEKILYMDAALLNAGGAYPADADDYTTAVIPAEATFVDYEVFANLPNIHKLIIYGDCEFDLLTITDGKTTTYKSALTYPGLAIREVEVYERAKIEAKFGQKAYQLNKVHISVDDMMSNAFTDCHALIDATIENSDNIGYAAFQNCYSLTKVSVPGNPVYINSYAFDGCSALERIEITALNSIASYAFNGCKNLREIILPEAMSESSTIAAIGTYAFYNCKNLESIHIPYGVAHIGANAFYYCQKLSSIDIPDSVTIISASAFYYCSGLTSLTLSSKVTEIPSSMCGFCSNLTSINIPNGVTTINSMAFRYCTSLSAVTLPDSLISIASNAFGGCTNLLSVVIPASVTSISSDSFPATTVIRGYAGSYAETWATENGFTFEVIE